MAQQTGTHISTTQAQHSFARIPSVQIPRSVFNRSAGLKTTFDPGYIIPIFVDEALPGDTFSMKCTAFGRIATMLRPIMDNVSLDVFFFFVPNRLLWNNWTRFMGEQTNPGDHINYLVPQVTAPAAGGWTEQSIGDYMGVPTKINSLAANALPFRAYNLVYNQWFRDENLVSSTLVLNASDGPDPDTAYALKRRGKRHDYFTSALPFAQKGTAVALPLGTAATVRTQTASLVSGAQAALHMARSTDGAGVSGALGTSNAATTNVGQSAGAFTVVTGAYPANLYADLSTATAATINQLRESFQIQRLLEKDARGGTRYTELIRAHFGVVSPDARLQRPEFLGGGTIRINVNTVANTAANDTVGNVQPLAELGAFGTFAESGVGFRQSFTEHGIILGLASLRADLTYQQGLERMWSRRSRYEYYWPSLANLGEQPVLNKEIYAKNDANDNLVFGYQERYAEYRYKPSQITGKFRSNTTAPLDVWHLAQNFTALPTLGTTFIEENPPFSRIVAIPSEPIVLADFFFDLRCARPMPVFGTPGLIDHF